MALQKLVFRPGVNREGTDYDNEGGWFDVNLVRFRKGRPEKFGGWAKLISSTFLGTCRALHRYTFQILCSRKQRKFFRYNTNKKNQYK